MRAERLEWACNHDCMRDPICAANCLDVCVDYNNRVQNTNSTALVACGKEIEEGAEPCLACRCEAGLRDLHARLAAAEAERDEAVRTLDAMMNRARNVLSKFPSGKDLVKGGNNE